MVRMTFIIPKADNEGRKFPASVMLGIQRDILEMFGGYTVRNVSGGWIGEDGTIYEEENWEYTVVTEQVQVEPTVRWLEKVKAILRQEAMFLEVSEADARFI